MENKKILRLLIIVSFLQISWALDLPVRLPKQGQSDTDFIRKFLQNDAEPTASAKFSEDKEARIDKEHVAHNDGNAGARFQQKNEAYSQYSPVMTDATKALNALQKILKPGAIDSLKKIAESLTIHSMSNTLPPNTPSMTPERLTSLVTSAMNSQPEGLINSRINKVLENWKSQLSQPEYLKLLHLPQPVTGTSVGGSVPLPSFFQGQQPQYIQTQMATPQYGQAAMMPVSYMTMPMQTTISSPPVAFTQESMKPVELSNIHELQLA